jgi:hypothetical protein
MRRHDCRPGLRCEALRGCQPAVGAPCAPAGFLHDDCPPSEGSALACVERHCVITDGAAGSPCDYAAMYGDCAIGLACHSDGRCRALLAEGEACPPTADIGGSDCASGCCAGEIARVGAIRMGVCQAQPQ